MSSRVLVVDNYDSFVYILVQYLGELGLEPIVFRNDKLSLHDVADLDVDAILISPGPGTPLDSGISMELIREYKELTYFWRLSRPAMHWRILWWERSTSP